jgi:hypothetical protein
MIAFPIIGGERWRTNFTNAFRLRKATYFNQAAGARSTEGLHGIAQRAYGIHSEGMAWNHRQGRCMELPRSGAWNPFRRNGMESSPRAMHVIAASRRMESAQRAAWNHTEGVHGITAKGGVLTGAFFVRKYLLTIVRDCVIILGI